MRRFGRKMFINFKRGSGIPSLMLPTDPHAVVVLEKSSIIRKSMTAGRIDRGNDIYDRARNIFDRAKSQSRSNLI